MLPMVDSARRLDRDRHWCLLTHASCRVSVFFSVVQRRDKKALSLSLSRLLLLSPRSFIRKFKVDGALERRSDAGRWNLFLGFEIKKEILGMKFP